MRLNFRRYGLYEILNRYGLRTRDLRLNVHGIGIRSLFTRGAMNIPYQCLSRLGQSSILCAAKGTSIHTFELDGGPSFLSSWSHPKTEQASSSKGPVQESRGNDEQENDKHPSKKRKLDSDEKPRDVGEPSQSDTVVVEAEANGNGQKKPKPDHHSQRTELPFVALLTSTEDGSHVVAVTGQNKTLWVFEHDGNGMLKELSHRVMPKRPSAINITTDGTTILSADKFGDVYSLPLIPSPSPEAASTPTPTPSTPSTTAVADPTPFFKPAASRLTVHSKRNLRALEEQERTLAKRKAKDKDADGHTFEHLPILGHVSMLTAMALATTPSPSLGGGSKPYIITADRDEHIRVSRGPPQAHVIETYCLGHRSFVAALCVPSDRPEVLVSGGGDDDLFLWDWAAGRLLRTAGLLSRAREVVPDTSRIAVSRLRSYAVGGRCYVLAICELIPAVFIFQLQQNNALEHVQTLAVPGNPLDALTIPRSEKAPSLIVAIDPLQSTGESEAQEGADSAEKAPSLLVFEQGEDGSWAQSSSIHDTAEGNLELSREELENVLYPVGNLRKTEFEDDGE
ncbi:hypothetical protein GGR54DRAFT_586249 [Hypoxylon sp. NC1633]|nr:hypothetical protein GGR54DRAFT_586249 [Hypoxylon sp. NC1633]